MNLFEEEISWYKDEISKYKSELLKYNKIIYEKRNFIIDAELKHIDSLNGLGFENYISILLENLGYDTEVTQSTGDQGIDVLATKGGICLAVQCKLYNSSVGNTAIQEAFAGTSFYGSDLGVVCTNNFFTRSAIQLAGKLGIELWDRTHLINLTNERLDRLYNLDQTSYIEIPTIIPTTVDQEVITEETKDSTNCKDEIYYEAVQFVMGCDSTSISNLQRRFRIGYNRAARLIDEMESNGVISAANGSIPRSVIKKSFD